MRLFILALLSLSLAGAQWNPAATDSTASLRGIHNAGGGVIWASGSNGTVLRSEDDGYMWQKCKLPPAAMKLDFRAVFAWDANHAQAMSSGTGSASQLYETTDGGASWHLLFENPDHDGFWDALTFRGKSGFLLGDPVNGRFVFYQSDDLGQHWHRDDSPNLAAANGEGVFAASNSSLVVLPDSEVLFATGGVGGARVFHRDKSRRWSATKVPIAAGTEGSGIFSIAFRDNAHGVTVGGDYKQPAKAANTAAWTSDGGATWQSATNFPSGYRSSVAWSQESRAWIAVGTNGSDISRDDGHTWKRIGAGDWNALSVPWAAGEKGLIASLDTASRLLR
ncbi:MAG: glycosyl hydrolase [Acidobacteriaceae bacterium]|nr:glycosyl hydrolase [Acidobacteriaceae bacterium]